MSSEPKPIDRQRPFRRIGNTAFLPTRVLDGQGAACGCRIDKDLGDINAKLDKFVADTKEEVLGKPLAEAIKIIRLLLKPSLLVDLLRDEIAKVIGKDFANAVTGLFKVFAAFLDALLLPANAIVNAVIGAVEAAFEAFLKTIGRGLLHRANRVLPHWVPVDPAQSNNSSVDRAQVIEVEGVCTRSFGNPVDVPLAQWHTWFAWNVELALEPEYARALSPAGDPPNTDGMAAGVERSIIKPGTFEVQWDAGALLGRGEQAAFNGRVADNDTPKHDGPMTIAAAQSQAQIENSGTNLDTAFVWPMPGMFVWASGRHVYDCSRVTHGPRPSKDAQPVEARPPLMPAMIQPARALATARFQAFQFRENGNFFVPAVQFMFIACRRGGYIDHDALADEDYVFVIDLPPAPATPVSPFPVAHSGKVPHNTVVVRPRLLKFLRFLQRIDGRESVDPVIEILPPEDPAAAPRQIRLTILRSSLDGAEAYGFTLTLGWHDPTRELARQVMLCELDLKLLRMRLSQRDDPAAKLRQLFSEEEGDLKRVVAEKLKDFEVDLPLIGRVRPLSIPGISNLIDDVVAQALTTFIDVLVGLLPGEGEEEWLLRIGVNGVWVSFFFKPGKKEEKTFLANELTFKLALAKGDELSFASHGTEFDPVGDMMHGARDARTLKLDGRAPTWPQIVKPATEAERDRLLFALMRMLLFDTTEGISKLSLGFDNQPLGLVDPDPDQRGPSQQHDPMVIGDATDGALKAQRIARFARAIAPEMILVEDTRDAPITRFPVRPDYEVRYELRTKPQLDDQPKPD